MHEFEQFPDIEAYYAAHPEARASVESDYGVWWKDEDGGNWRVTYVHETGHVYAICLGSTSSGLVSIGGEEAVMVSAGDGRSGPVVILGTIEACGDIGLRAPDPAERVLEGWADKCGEQGSLAWVIGRLREE